MTSNQKLLLLSIWELRCSSLHLKFLRKHCCNDTIYAILNHQQTQLTNLEWESRQLAIQRGLEPPEYENLFCRPLRFPFLFTTARLVHSWYNRNKVTCAHIRRALRQYPRADSVSIFCQKCIDFSTGVMHQLNPYL